MTRPLPGIALGLALVLALAAAACGDDETATTSEPTTAATTTSAVTTGPTTTAGTSTSGASTTGTPTTAETPPSAATTTSFPGDTSDKSGAGEGGLLTGVRIGEHEGYTRIVFDFRPPSIPNWEFGYVPGEIHGMIEPEGGWVEGDAFLVARFQPSMTADLSGDDVVITYDGPRRIDVGLGSVAQLLIIEDFEAQLWWAIGLTGERPFRVGTMTGPPRIYVDIAD